jgi:hypothetical protein
VKRLVEVLLVATTVIFLTACTGGNETTEAPTHYTLSKTRSCLVDAGYKVLINRDTGNLVVFFPTIHFDLFFHPDEATAKKWLADQNPGDVTGDPDDVARTKGNVVYAWGGAPPWTPEASVDAWRRIEVCIH